MPMAKAMRFRKAADRAGPQRTQRRAEVGQVQHAVRLVRVAIFILFPGDRRLVAHGRQGEPEDADGDDDAPHYQSEDSWDAQDERVHEAHKNRPKEPEPENVPHAHHHVGVHLFRVVPVLGFGGQRRPQSGVGAGVRVGGGVAPAATTAAAGQGAVGGIGSLLGRLVARRRRDLLRLLAYTIIHHIRSRVDGRAALAPPQRLRVAALRVVAGP